ncbi:MAG: 50S ribosomal protein L11 methyltransferase [Hyphomicrobiales bacterium]
MSLTALHLRGTRETAQRAAGALEMYIEPPLSVSWFEETKDVWALEALFAEAECAERAGQSLAATLGIPAASITIAPLAERDWVAQSLQGLAPVAAGRIVVHGAHNRADIAPGMIGVEIEAGMAFGTGHHATTLGCLLALQFAAKRAELRSVLDLGTGTGVLAIAAARLLRCPVLATDIDPVAVKIARANARANRVGPLISCRVANGVASQEIAASAPYDMILANILARPLARMAPGLRPLAAKGGAIVLSGLLTEQIASVVAPFRTCGFILDRSWHLGEWTTLLLRAG